MIRTTTRWGGLALASVLAIAGCDDDDAESGDDAGSGQADSGPADSGAADSGGGTPTFSADVWPILEASCSCHNSATGRGGLVMTEAEAYDNLVDAPATTAAAVRIAPGSVADSYLYAKVTGTQTDFDGGAGGTMPLGGTLGDAELRVLEAWIDAGAPR